MTSLQYESDVPLRAIGPLFAAVAFRKRCAKRQMVVVDKTLQSERGSDAACPAPHHLRMPTQCLRHGHQALAAELQYVIVVTKRFLHCGRLGDAGLRLQFILLGENNAIRSQRPRPHAFTAKAVRERAEARLPNDIQHVDQHRTLNDEPVLHLMDFAIRR